MIKKIIVMFLLLSIILQTAACTTVTTGDNADKVEGSKGNNLETMPPSEYVKPDVDLKSKTFIFSSLENPNSSWISGQYVEAFANEMNGDIINDAIYMRIMQTEEVLGVTIKPNVFATVDQLIKPTLAGDHYADTILVTGVHLRTILSQNILIDLYDIPTLQLEKSWWDSKAIEGLSIGGKLFAAAGNISSFGVLGSYSVFVNKSLIENFKLENPYDLVHSGKWTLDAMERMGKEVASDLNGDGVMDGEDLFGLSSEALGILMLISCGIRITDKDSSDLPVLTINTEKAPSVVEKVVRLFRNKEITLYSSDFASGYKNVFREFIVQMFLQDQLLFINNWLHVALELRNMQSDFGILPPAKFDESQEDYIVSATETYSTYAVVPITNNDLETTGHVMNALGNYGKEYIHKALIDITITNKTLRDTDTEKMLDIIYSNRRYDLASIFDWGGINAMAKNFISSNNANFASAYSSNESKILAAIKTTLDAIK